MFDSGSFFGRRLHDLHFDLELDPIADEDATDLEDLTPKGTAEIHQQFRDRTLVSRHRDVEGGRPVLFLPCDLGSQIQAGDHEPAGPGAERVGHRHNEASSPLAQILSDEERAQVTLEPTSVRHSEPYQQDSVMTPWRKHTHVRKVQVLRNEKTLISLRRAAHTSGSA